MKHTGVMTYWADRVGFYVLGGLLCFILGGAFGTLTMKWTVDGELRSLRQQNHELADNARKLAAAAYVCMDHCGTPTCEGR